MQKSKRYDGGGNFKNILVDVARTPDESFAKIAP